MTAVVIAAGMMLVPEFIHPLALSAPTLRAALETCMTLFGLASALLLRVEVTRTRRLGKLLLLAGLLTVSITEFVGNALPAALHARLGSGFAAVPPFGQLSAAALLAAAALVPSDALVRGGKRPVAQAALASFGAVGVSELVGLLLRNSLLGDPIASQLGTDSAWRHPIGVVVLLVTVVLFAIATIEFARRSQLEGGSFLSLLAGAVALLAAARLYYLAMPTISPEMVTFREPMRLVAFGLVFLALLRRDLATRSSASQAAAISERQRVAQDLHDGLAQDLAVIVAHAGRMSMQLGAEHPVVVAARRALALSRGTIGELSDGSSASVRELLEVIAHDLGNRFAIEIVVDVQFENALPPETRRHVARIVREAIANAARHGDATHVIVTLKRASGGLALRIRDDGRGIFDASGGPAVEGFGLRNMRERADALSGSFVARPRSDRGTEVEVVFPW